MGSKSKGFRRKSRHLLSLKSNQSTGLSYLLQNYKENDDVVVVLSPNQVKGMPHRRFHGKVGKVKKVMRRSVSLSIKSGNKVKTVISRFEHITPHNK